MRAPTPTEAEPTLCHPALRSPAQIELEFTTRTVMATIDSPTAIHRFYIERLAWDVDAGKCTAVITKKRMLLIKLWKVNRYELWTKLRGF